MADLLTQLHEAQTENQALRAELANLHSRLITYQYIHPANAYKALEKYKNESRYMSLDDLWIRSQ